MRARLAANGAGGSLVPDLLRYHPGLWGRRMSSTMEQLEREQAWYAEHVHRIAAEINRRFRALEEGEWDEWDDLEAEEERDRLAAPPPVLSLPALVAEDPDDRPYEDWPQDSERLAIVAAWAETEGLLVPGGAARLCAFRSFRRQVADAVLRRCQDAVRALPVETSRPLLFASDATCCAWALEQGVITRAEYALVSAERGRMFNYTGD